MAYARAVACLHQSPPTARRELYAEPHHTRRLANGGPAYPQWVRSLSNMPPNKSTTAATAINGRRTAKDGWPCTNPNGPRRVVTPVQKATGLVHGSVSRHRP